MRGTKQRGGWARQGAACVLALAGAAVLPGAGAAGPVDRMKVEAALPRLEAMAQAMVEAGEAPGIAIGVVHDDEVVWLRGFGVREAGKPAPVDADTVFQIASMSKPISATVVAALVGREVLDWGTRVADLDPGFALHDPYPTAEVTVRDLFNHRSGLPGSAGNDLEQIGFDRPTVMARLRLAPPSSSFRAGYSYSNAGITAGALAAVKPTGKDWETVAEDELFTPLGMTSTSYRYEAFTGRENASSLHMRAGDAWEARIRYDPATQAPAGAASSSVRDLTAWMRLELANGGFDGAPLIDAEALAATHAPLMARGRNPITGAASFYGLGWNVEFGRYGVTWGHAGAFSYGARTVVTLLPESGLGIVVLANAFPTGLPEALADSFLDLVIDGEVRQDYLAGWNALYESLFGPQIEAAKATYARPPDPATPALPAAAYAGRYANAYVGEAEVAELATGGLVLVIGPGGARHLPLTHFDRDLFLYFPDDEMPDKPSLVSFAVGPDGSAQTITVESVNDNGLGTLARVGR